MENLFGHQLPFTVETKCATVLDADGIVVADMYHVDGDEDAAENANALCALFVEAAHKKAGIA